jgi:hypothetical protein
MYIDEDLKHLLIEGLLKHLQFSIIKFYKLQKKILCSIT